ncbi:hypothetical protein PR001_g14904 [Phytophthora rubi]|uniref:HECT domain-containing protein n=1 Tax=Phytophthora rubi TaxID=129364 RepID=A0A6A3L7K3_9STRA|nr:hypothetical protein PR001_g14904 [Phytophthora rubi]KAE9037329.1 hypothetical protein PR002_g6633 [Phytophthora rubi]
MHMTFLDDSGVDVGWLHREGFMMLTKLLTNTKAEPKPHRGGLRVRPGLEFPLRQ